MSKNIFKSLVTFLLLLSTFALSGCLTTSHVDNNAVSPKESEHEEQYEGHYKNQTNELYIQKVDGEYNIRMYLDISTVDDTVVISGTGYIENETLYYTASDNFENDFYGNIESYGEDYPIRVELYDETTDEFIDELEFEKEK